MTRVEAIARAMEAALQQGWTWLEPVEARRTRRWLIFGRDEWHVRSNADSIGSNVYVVIDDRSGQVVHRAWLPR